MVVDAVNWYIGSDWQIIRRTISDRGPDTLHPESTDRSADDPVAWVAERAVAVIMDYGLKIWWDDDLDVIREA